MYLLTYRESRARLTRYAFPYSNLHILFSVNRFTWLTPCYFLPTLAYYGTIVRHIIASIELTTTPKGLFLPLQW